MAKYRLKEAPAVEAVQWFKEGDHPRVTVGADTLITKGGHAAYIEHLAPMSTVWVTVEALTPEKFEALKASDAKQYGMFPSYNFEFTHEDGTVYYRKAYPFNFWSFKGEKQYIPRDELSQLFEDCLMIEAQLNKRKIEDYTRFGMMNPPDRNGRLAVFPGDWIVNADGRIEIIDKEQFSKRYEAAE